nr:hypothetical protein Csa_1G574925 [Ipomoea trifida]
MPKSSVFLQYLTSTNSREPGLTLPTAPLNGAKLAHSTTTAVPKKQADLYSSQILRASDRIQSHLKSSTLPLYQNRIQFFDTNSFQLRSTQDQTKI